jgi:molybdenum cofactor guanylyltransferase
MGRAKALLPVGGEVMLQRVVRILASQVCPIAVVAAAEQELPDLSEEWIVAFHSVKGRSFAERKATLGAAPAIRIARDPVEHRGPLAGLAVGMTALRGEVELVYASACDAPLLKPAFVRAMIDSLGDAQIVVPFDGRYHHPLAAVYRVSVLPVIEELLAADRLRPVFLFEKCRTREVPVEELRCVDPDLDSLCNTNTAEEYASALARVAAEESP